MRWGSLKSQPSRIKPRIARSSDRLTKLTPSTASRDGNELLDLAHICRQPAGTSITDIALAKLAGRGISRCFARSARRTGKRLLYEGSHLSEGRRMIGIERMAAAYLFLNKGPFHAVAAPGASRTTEIGRKADA